MRRGGDERPIESRLVLVVIVVAFLTAEFTHKVDALLKRSF